MIRRSGRMESAGPALLSIHIAYTKIAGNKTEHMGQMSGKEGCNRQV
jgi:hypothetical protein